MRRSDALCVFIKAPRLGEVKTRLQPEITPEDGLRLYQAMVENLLDQFKDNLEFDLFLFYWPAGCEAELRQWLGNGYDFVLQEGKDLGERMTCACQWTFDRHYEKTVIVGSDIPTLNVNDIGQAFSLLDRMDVVLGPSRDGGYYLIGLKHPYPGLFEEIPWSSDLVYHKTLEKIEEQRLSLAELSEKDDLDTFEDVLAFWKEFKGSLNKSNSKRMASVLRNLFDNHSKEMHYA